MLRVCRFAFTSLLVFLSFSSWADDTECYSSSNVNTVASVGTVCADMLIVVTNRTPSFAASSE